MIFSKKEIDINDTIEFSLYKGYTDSNGHRSSITGVVCGVMSGKNLTSPENAATNHHVIYPFIPDSSDIKKIDFTVGKYIKVTVDSIYELEINESWVVENTLIVRPKSDAVIVVSNITNEETLSLIELLKESGYIIKSFNMSV